MVPAGNQAKRLSSVNHTTITNHHYHHHHHHQLTILSFGNFFKAASASVIILFQVSSSMKNSFARLIFFDILNIDNIQWKTKNVYILQLPHLLYTPRNLHACSHTYECESPKHICKQAHMFEHTAIGPMASFARTCNRWQVTF